MAKDSIITGIDIGSTTIRIVVGQRAVTEDGEGKLNVLGMIEMPSEGISKGVVTGIEDAVSSVSACLEKGERLIGMPIEHAYVSISSPDVVCQTSRGVIAVSKADGEIREDDVERVIEAAQAVSTPPNYEILHVIPKSFVVDNQAGIKDPVGMTGVRLEVEALILLGLSTQIRNLTKAIYRTGVEIDDLVLSTLAAAESSLSKKQKDLGAALLNLGATTSSLIVFEEGDMLHTTIIPVGASHVTSDIAIGFRTSVDVAERIKLDHGTAVSTKVARKDEVDLGDYSSQDDDRVSKRELSQIIEARVEEIFGMADKELKKVDRSGLLPAGVVLTGGGSKLVDVVDVAKQSFRLPSSIGYPAELTSIAEKIHDPAYSVALGLVLWGYESEAAKQAGSRLAGLSGKLRGVRGIGSKLRKVFKSIVP